MCAHTHTHRETTIGREAGEIENLVVGNPFFRVAQGDDAVVRCFMNYVARFTPLWIKKKARAISPQTFLISFLIRFCALNFQKISNAFAGFSRRKCVAEGATGSIKKLSRNDKKNTNMHKKHKSF